MLINFTHNGINYLTQDTPCRVAATLSPSEVDKPSTLTRLFVSSMAYVYRHIRLDKNEPFYIGIGADDEYKRAYDKHKGRRSEVWFRVVEKTDYEVEILFDNVSTEFAKQKEIEFIKIHGRRDIGTGTLVNMTDGGDGLNNRVFTPEYRRKLSEANKGRILSDAHKAKLREISRNRNFSPEKIAEIGRKVSIANKGRKLPHEQIEKLKLRTGTNNPMYGKANYNFKGNIQAFKNGDLVGEYRGVHECAKQLNVTATKISACLNGRRNKTGGYTFKRVEV